jgi:hypothetical protein
MLFTSHLCVVETALANIEFQVNTLRRRRRRDFGRGEVKTMPLCCVSSGV